MGNPVDVTLVKAATAEQLEDPKYYGRLITINENGVKEKCLDVHKEWMEIFEFGGDVKSAPSLLDGVSECALNLDGKFQAVFDTFGMKTHGYYLADAAGPPPPGWLARVWS